MHKYRTLGWLVALAGVLLLAGCAPDTSAPELQPTVMSASPTAEQGVAVADTSGGAQVARVEFTDTACLACHTNQDILKALAVEDETPESLSSGPG